MSINKKPPIAPTIKNFEHLGPITFVASSRARRVNITIKASGSIRVAVPKRVPLAVAEKFVLSKQLWIAKQLVRLEKRQSEAKNFSEKIEEFNIEKATDRLAHRLQELAREHEFSYNKLTIRNQKTRWGSCSAKNNISLNIKLSLLPEELMDLVIVHELIHTIIKNHGPKFWQKLEEIYPKARKLDREVNNYSGLLHLPL